MSNWEDVWNSNDEYVLQRIWNENIPDFEFRIERKLLNLPRVEIIHLPSLTDLTDEQKTLINLGYTHQFVISELTGNVRYPSSSLDSLEHHAYYLIKAERILKKMQHEVSRTLDIWIA